MDCWTVRKVVVALVFFGSIAVDADDTKSAVPPDLQFTQYVDHFTITDNRQWKQRYQVITDHYQNGGPVFLVLGGEWDISDEELPKHTTIAYAKKLKGMVFQLEHRFYGESRPTSQVTNDDLVYLSADQALADAAYFIKGMTKEHKLPEGTKWIAFGGYLAVSIRDKYPHLVYASVADGPSLLAKANFYEFLNIVRYTLARYNPQCPISIQEAHKKVKELLKTPEGQKTVQEKFRLCKPLDPSNKGELYYFLRHMATTFSSLVMYNGSEDMTINKACDILVDTSQGDVLDRYVKVNNLYEEAGGSDCTDLNYGEMVEGMKKTSWDDEKVKGGSRPYYYQSCTQFGQFQTSVHPDDLFLEDIPVEAMYQQCTDIFGESFNKDLTAKGVYRTNLMLGALDCQATRVVYVYSELDPWRPLGMPETKVLESPVILIKGAYHDTVTSAPADDSSEAAKDAWNQVQDLVEKWCSS